MGAASAACPEATNFELKTRLPVKRGERGAAHAYNIKAKRAEERHWGEQAE